MDYTKNQKYFKPASKLWIAGLPIIVIGAVLSILMNYSTKMIGIVIAIAGVIWTIAFLTSGMKDDDIDGAVASKMNTIEADASEQFKFPRRYEVLHPAVILGGFDFTRTEETPVKRGKDLKYRNGFYCGLLINFTNDGLRILSRKFSLLKDDCVEENLHFAWEELDSSRLDEQEVTFKMVDGKEATIKVDVLKIVLKNGKTLEYCVKNTADVDETMDMIYRQCVRVKQEELKNKA
ncbi:MAG: hypothetical protein J6I50_10600 [Clostridia bacterium]|nr:hypothetical protein [Clostridia bacterium]